MKKKSEHGFNGTCCGQKLNLMAVVLANYVSEGLTIKELEILSSFAQLVSESINNIAVAKALENNKEEIIEEF